MIFCAGEHTGVFHVNVRWQFAPPRLSSQSPVVISLVGPATPKAGNQCLRPPSFALQIFSYLQFLRLLFGAPGIFLPNQQTSRLFCDLGGRLSFIFVSETVLADKSPLDADASATLVSGVGLDPPDQRQLVRHVDARARGDDADLAGIGALQLVEAAASMAEPSQAIQSARARIDADELKRRSDNT